MASKEQVKSLIESVFAAATEGQWQSAISLTHEVRRLSEVGSKNHAWATANLTSLYADTGRVRETRQFGSDYMHRYAGRKDTEKYTPYVLRALSHGQYQQRHFAQAVALRERALALFQLQGNEHDVLVTKLNLVWACARSRRPSEARTYLPDSVPDAMLPLWYGALCVVLAAEGRNAEAIEAGRQAFHGEREAKDMADLAEVLFTMALAAKALGNQQESNDLMYLAKVYASQQCRNAFALFIIHFTMKGGDGYVETVSRGSRNPLHACAYTCGIG